jgi:phosphatidylserine/phosphatidylglycerophosphate/cardiolipin synthase-like enzyme
MFGNARLLLGAAVAVLVSCAPTRGAAPPAENQPSIELVETSPVETTLRHPDMPQAKDVWLQMVQSSSSSIDFAEFYASNAPGSALERIVEAVESAAGRGVRVRFLSEEKFYKTYPETLDRLAARPSIEVRRYPTAQLSGGVMHAKYFIVDGRRAYLGSQNFDWRSLEHIQELGARVEIKAVVDALSDVFETDWALAQGAPRDFRVRAHSAGDRFPVTVPFRGEALQITPVFSPKGWLPEESLWDLPCLVATIDGARQTVRVQLLTYRAHAQEGPAFLELDNALRRAAARGVSVQLLVSHWSARRELIGELQRLQASPHFTVKLLTIPPASVGFIPFARVAHAKYMVVDGQYSWLGTSNWERDYFERSRNVGLLIDSSQIGGQLDSFFLGNWDSPYAQLVDPSKSYEEPRIGE